MVDSPALALLRRIWNRIDIEHHHNHDWEDAETEGRSRAGWVFEVREEQGWRSFSITVESGFVSDAEAELMLKAELERQTDDT